MESFRFYSWNRVMAQAATASEIQTLADLLHSIGDIAPERVRLRPTPGTATKQDLLALEGRGDRIYEVVDGVLVEKPMGYYESVVAATIVRILGSFVVPRKLGLVSGADGGLEFREGLIRVPDVGYAARERFPQVIDPTDRVPAIVPDLAVEILSKSNTAAEMKRKRMDYFQAGVRLVWMVDLATRTVAVYDQPENPTILSSTDTLTGGDVLPGLEVLVKDIFADLAP